MDKSIKVKAEPGIVGAKNTLVANSSEKIKKVDIATPLNSKSEILANIEASSHEHINNSSNYKRKQVTKKTSLTNNSCNNNQGAKSAAVGSKIQVKLEKDDPRSSSSLMDKGTDISNECNKKPAVLRDKTNVNLANRVQNNASMEKKSFKDENKDCSFPEKSNKHVTSQHSQTKVERMNKSKIIEFMMEIPEINKSHSSKDNNVSKFSSPFSNRTDMAGTNLTLQTRATKEPIEEENDILSGKSTSKFVRFGDLKDESGSNLSSLKLRESSEGDENSSFLSSPCVERKLKQKRTREGNECGTDQELIRKMRLKKARLELSSNEHEGNDNINFNSMDATNGSDEEVITDKIIPPPKYKVIDTPVYEYMEGEDAIYYEILGKKDRNEELDNNEKQFFEFVSYGFEQWSEQSLIFTREYNNLMKKVILARIKFDRRVKYLKDNLDIFALDLEKQGEEINKRSDILKEYCEKIVQEIE